MPTITEAGFDVVVSNWRGLMTHPGITAEADADLIDLVTQAHDTPDWQDILTKNGWTTLPDRSRLRPLPDRRGAAGDAPSCARSA